MISDNAPSELSYLWIPAEGVACPSCALTEVMPWSTTRYQIVASDSLGCRYDTTWLVSVDRQNSIYIPNAFSPNGDGVNDEFRVFPGLGVVAVLELVLFDRWGNRIFQSDNCGASCSWSGMIRGQVAPPEFYTYAIRIEYIDGTVRWLSGEVQLLK
jgi:gliding motility-associated-like protein